MLYFQCCNFTSFDPILASSSLNKTVSPYLSGNTSFKVLPQVILKLVGGSGSVKRICSISKDICTTFDPTMIYINPAHFENLVTWFCNFFVNAPSARKATKIYTIFEYPD